MKIVVIQGPNLNMLGVREPQLYGPMRLEQIHAQMKEVATQNGIEIEFYQSNLEGEIVDRIQECYGDADESSSTRRHTPTHLSRFAMRSVR